MTASTEPRLLWALANQQEAAWLFAQVSFVPDAPYLITFEGVRGNDVLGTVGIDDVTLFPGACSLGPTEVKKFLSQRLRKH